MWAKDGPWRVESWAERETLRRTSNRLLLLTILLGVLLLLGVYTRYVSIALVPVLIGAAWAHFGNGWVFSAPNGGWEYPVFLAVATVVQFLIGDGAFALRRTAPNQQEGVAYAAV